MHRIVVPAARGDKGRTALVSGRREPHDQGRKRVRLPEARIGGATMAIAGDPFVTSSLDERRRRQRRHLRTLDRAIIDLATDPGEPHVPPGTDRAWLEVELRRCADLEMVHIDELFRRCEDARAKNMVAGFLRQNLGDDPDGALESLADALTAEGARGWLDGISPRERVAVRRYLQLARWADLLAPDEAC
jgi:hypothetical protein